MKQRDERKIFSMNILKIDLEKDKKTWYELGERRISVSYVKLKLKYRRTGSNNNSGSQFKQYKFSAAKGWKHGKS